MTKVHDPFTDISDILQCIIEEVQHHQSHNHGRDAQEDANVYRVLSSYISFFLNAKHSVAQVTNQASQFPNESMMELLKAFGMPDKYRQLLTTLVDEGDTFVSSVNCKKVADIYAARVHQCYERLLKVAGNEGTSGSSTDDVEMSVTGMLNTGPLDTVSYSLLIKKATEAYLLALVLYEALYKPSDITKSEIQHLDTILRMFLMLAIKLGFGPTIERVGVSVANSSYQISSTLILVAERSVATTSQVSRANLRSFLKPIQDYLQMRDSDHARGAAGAAAVGEREHVRLFQSGQRTALPAVQFDDHFETMLRPAAAAAAEDDAGDTHHEVSTTHALFTEGDDRRLTEQLCSELKRIHMAKETLQRQAEIIKELAIIHHREARDRGNSDYFIFASGLLNAALVRAKQDSLKSEIIAAIQAVHKDFLCKVCNVLQEEGPWNHWPAETGKNASRLADIRGRAHQMSQHLNSIIERTKLNPDMQQLLVDEKFVIDLTATAFGRIADMMKKFVRELISECESVLGPPPCRYAVMGLGSLAREEATPFSHLEFAVLIDEVHPNHAKTYFWKLVQYLHLKVLDLGETPLSSLFIPCLNDFYSDDVGKHWFYDSFTPSGFKFDGSMLWACPMQIRRKGCASTKPAQDLILTPSQMAALQNLTQTPVGNYHLHDVLYCTCLITGDKALYEIYSDALHGSYDKFCSSERLQNWLRRRAAIDRNLLISNDFKRSRDTCHIILPFLLKVKPCLYRMPSVMLTNLRIHNSSKLSSTWAFLDYLRQCVGDSCFDALHQVTIWIALVHLIKLVTFDAKCCQNESLSFFPEGPTQHQEHIECPAKLNNITNNYVRLRLACVAPFAQEVIQSCQCLKETSFPWLAAGLVWVSQELVLDYTQQKLSQKVDHAILLRHTRALQNSGDVPVSLESVLLHVHAFFSSYKDMKLKGEEEFLYPDYLSELLSIANSLMTKQIEADDRLTEELCAIAKDDVRNYARNVPFDMKDTCILVQYTNLSVATDDYSDLIHLWHVFKYTMATKNGPSEADKQSKMERAMSSVDCIASKQKNDEKGGIVVELIDLMVGILEYKQQNEPCESTERDYAENLNTLRGKAGLNSLKSDMSRVGAEAKHDVTMMSLTHLVSCASQLLSSWQDKVHI